jgi:hypothetical protein
MHVVPVKPLIKNSTYGRIVCRQEHRHAIQGLREASAL